jgi:hypothetical protein
MLGPRREVGCKKDDRCLGHLPPPVHNSNPGLRAEQSPCRTPAAKTFGHLGDPSETEVKISHGRRIR